MGGVKRGVSGRSARGRVGRGRKVGARPAAGRRLPREHRAGTSAPRPVGCVVVTVSDTRRGTADRSGDHIERLIERAGYTVPARAWVRDEPVAIRRAVRAALARPEVDAVVLTGGTGIGPRDRTPEAVAPLVARWLPGFGELFRVLSLEQVGSAAWLSRAAAGVAGGKLVVMLPGSTAAVELAVERLLLPELAHALRMLGRFHPGE